MSKVLAKVADTEITDEMLDFYLENVQGTERQYASNPKYREQFLQQMIARTLFVKMAEDEKLDETDDFAKIMESAKNDILYQMELALVLKDVTVTEEDEKAFYETQKEYFKKDETVNAKHILHPEEEKIGEIKEQIEKGEVTFEDAAQEHSTCPSKERGGDLGEFARGQMVKEFEDAAFEAEIGKVVGPVKTQFGYHLIKVEKKTDASYVPFEEVQEEIHKELLQHKQQEAYNTKLAELKAKYMKNEK